MFDDQRRSLRLRLGKRCAPVLTIAAIAIAAPLTAQEVTVRRGDTLTGISSETGVPIARIVAYNGIRNPNLIYEGQVLRIPPTEGEIEHTVVAGDTLGAIARRYGSTIDAIVARNALSDPDRIVAGRTLIIPPAGTTAPATTAVPATTAAPTTTAAPATTAAPTTAAPAPAAPPTTAAPTTAAPTTPPPTTAPPTTAAPATTAPAPGGAAPGVVVSTIWLIQQGDTVTSIAAKVGVTPQRLADANSIAVSTALVPGHYLFVPQR